MHHADSCRPYMYFSVVSRAEKGGRAAKLCRLGSAGSRLPSFFEPGNVRCIRKTAPRRRRSVCLLHVGQLSPLIPGLLLDPNKLLGQFPPRILIYVQSHPPAPPHSPSRVGDTTLPSFRAVLLLRTDPHNRHARRWIEPIFRAVLCGSLRPSSADASVRLFHKCQQRGGT
jgi:hypothetical protein